MTDTITILREGLDAASRSWLADAEERAFGTEGEHQHALPVWEVKFAEAGRHCRGTQDSVRILLLHAVRPEASTLMRLYEHGTAAERCAILLALPHLAHIPPGAGLSLVEDALRTNDTRLVVAAVGPFAAEHLDDHAWRHAVLKCLFSGVPLAEFADVERRAAGDRELARMLTDFAAERIAAGRPVPDDLRNLLRFATQEF